MAAKNDVLLRLGRVLTKAGARLTGRKSSLATIQGEYRRRAEGLTALTDFRISAQSFFTIYRSHGDVSACVRELSESVGISGYEWLDKRDSNAEPNKLEIDLVEEILNKNRSFRRFKAKVIQHASISGNAYVHIEKNMDGQPIGLGFVDPRQMYVITDQAGAILKWIQRKNGGVETVEFLPEEIAHFKMMDDTDSAVFGLSPMEPVIWEVRSDLAAMNSNFAFFQNYSVPAAQYILDDELTDEEQTSAIAQIEEQIKGAENAHKSLAVKGVKDIKQMMISNRDMEFMVLRKFTTEKVCATYGVPKGVLNYTDSVNYSNGKEQTQKFWEGTIEPLEESFAEFINKILLPKLGIETIKIDFRPRSFDNREWNEESSRRDIEHGVMSINEVRELRSLETLDPAVYGEWVDRPLITKNLQALEDLGIGDQLPDQQSIQDAIDSVKNWSPEYGKEKTAKQ